MSKSPAPNEWREARRQSARDAIVDAAWVAGAEEGLAALTSAISRSERVSRHRPCTPTSIRSMRSTTRCSPPGRRSSRIA